MWRSATSTPRTSRCDCGTTDTDDLEPIVETVVDALHDLYVKAGARNLVLIDVPPVDRSPQGARTRSASPRALTTACPAVASDSTDAIAERVQTWNELLRAQAREFPAGSAHATVLLFSAHEVLTEVLDDPEAFDLDEDDPETEGGGFWEDDLHITEDMHEHLAEQLLRHVLPRS